MKEAIADWENGNLEDGTFECIIDNLVYEPREPSARALAVAKKIIEEDNLAV